MNRRTLSVPVVRNLIRQVIPIVFGLVSLPLAGETHANESSICDRAAVVAARESGVPVPVLQAISLTETGVTRDGQTRPWPWTVNMEGKGRWFDTPDAVLQYVRKEFARGARSFDLGCFQINYRWHGEAFRSLDHMLDPTENARYAARFLKSLHAEFGDWTRAAGAYHSRTPKFARRYEARFARFLGKLNTRPDTPEVLVAPQPDNQTTLAHPGPDYPILWQSGEPRGPASLVPLPATPFVGRLLDTRG